MLKISAVGDGLSETISLYLELKEGEKADFEVVGRAAAAFAEAVKEIAYILEPGIEVRLEFESGTEGSLNLKARLTELRTQVKTPEGRRAALVGVILVVGSVFVNNLTSYGFNKFLDSFLSPEQRSVLTDEDIERIVKAIKDAERGKIAKEPVRQVYSELERDDRITSVGTITKPKSKPIQPVPRSDFPDRSGITQQVETSTKKRKKKSVERLLLISPVLLSADRVWRLRSLLGEFSYHIDDRKFLQGVVSGRRHLPMKGGIELTAKVETHEALEGGVWVIKERHIEEVVRVHRKQQLPDLFSESKKTKSRKN